MVNVSVRENYGIDGLGSAFERQVVALLDIFGSLVETAIDVDAETIVLYESARTGDKAGRAEKLHAY